MSFEGLIIKTLDFFIYFIILFILIILFLLELQYIGFVQYDTYAEFNMLLKVYNKRLPKNLDRRVLHVSIDEDKKLAEYFIPCQFKVIKTLPDNIIIIKKHKFVISLGDCDSETDIQIINLENINTTNKLLYNYNGDVFWIRSI